MKKVVSMVLCIVFIITLLPTVTFTASAELPDRGFSDSYYGETMDTSGHGTGAIIGPEPTDSLTWKFESGTLTVSGEGEMARYPWKNYKGQITKVIIEEGVTGICSYAFKDCTQLCEIVIPDTVKYIGGYAFYNCNSLLEITIPKSVTAIGTFAFGGSTAISRVNIEDVAAWCSIDFSGTPIANPLNKGGALYLDGKQITNLVIPDGVKRIGYYAFYNYKTLKSVTIPSSVEYVGERAFENCTAIENVYIEDLAAWCDIYFGRFCGTSNPMMYGADLYLNNKIVENLIIPDGVERIYGYAFTGAESLKSVTVPESVLGIDQYAFADCTELSSIKLPDTLAYMGAQAFYNTKYYNITTNWKNGILYVGNYLTNAKKNVTAVVVKEGTKIIADGAFAGSTVNDLTLPEGLVSIGRCAFEECTALESVEIPESVKYIEGSAFIYCSGLTEVRISSPDVEIGSISVFLECNENLKLYCLRDSTAHAFAKSEKLNFTIFGDKPIYGDGWQLDTDGDLRIYINGKMTDAPWLEYKDRIKLVDMYTGLTSICDGAFKDCSNLAVIRYIPNTVTSVGKDVLTGTAYYNNSSSWIDGGLYYYGEFDNTFLFDIKNNEEIVIPDRTYIVADGLFKNNTTLEKITVPGTITLADGMFAGCTALREVNLSYGRQDIGNEIFKGCVALEKINVPLSVYNIGKSAFEGCVSLTEIDLPKNVKNIGESAFLDCPAYITVDENNAYYASYDGGLYTKDKTKLLYAGGVTSSEYVVEDGVKSVEPYAFYKNPNVESIVIPQGATAIGESAFNSCTKLKSVTIPYTVTEVGENAFANCDENLVIVCYEDSWIHEYAKENGIDYSIDDAGLLASGKYGEDLFWCIYEDGDFFMTGTGAMPDSIPWSEHKDKIKRITIGENVTSISDSAFEDCENLFIVTLPDSLTHIGNSTFEGCTDLTVVYMSKGIEEIGDRAFYGCTSLGDVEIYGSATRIGKSAFQNCTALSGITLPEKVMEIAEDAFTGTAYYNTQSRWEYGVLYCGKHALEVKNDKTTVIVKTGTINVANGAFAGCTAVQEVYLLSDVKNIGDRAFADCTNLTKLACSSNDVAVGEDIVEGCTNVVFHCFPDSNIRQFAKDNNYKYVCSSTLSNSAADAPSWSFDSQTGIFTYSKNGSGSWETLKDEVKKVVVEYGVTRISKGFEGFTALESVEIAEGVHFIAEGAFKNCTALKSVTMPDIGVVEIGEGAFEGCTSLEEIKLPSTLGTIGKRLFAGCTALENFTIPKNVQIIEESAFEGCSSLKNVVIPDGVKYIRASTFKNCTSLESITIPESVTTISDYAFANCSTLKSIKLPAGITRIYTGAFKGCSSLKTVDIPSGVTNINASAFADCTSLESVTIPNGVTSIGAYAFNNCTSLKTVAVPSTVTFVGKSAFENTAIYEVKENWENGLLYLGTYLAAAKPDVTVANIKAGTVFIAENLFKGCKTLESVTIPNSVTTIGDSAFESCPALKEIVIPSSVGSIGAFAFKDCISLEKASIQGNIGIIEEGLFSGCFALKSVNIPHGVTKIQEDAFFRCAALEGVIFPSTLKIIGNRAFFGCASLVDVTIVDNVKEIGFNAFEQCTGLTKVTILHKPFLAKHAFAGCENLTIYCYNDSSAKEYAEANNIPVVIISKPQNTAPVSGGGGGDSKPKPKAGLTNFKKVNEYAMNFTDVKENAWYFGDVKTSYELDLVKGISADKFNPTGDISIAEAITLASRIHSIYNTGKAEFVQGEIWYQVYVDYAIEKGIIEEGQFTDYNAPATREEFAEIFAKAIPESDYNPINNIENGEIPDVSENDAVYMLYNAGVVQGSDATHSFKPDTNIQRSEVAAIVTRIIDKTKRIIFEI